MYMMFVIINEKHTGAYVCIYGSVIIVRSVPRVLLADCKKSLLVYLNLMIPLVRILDTFLLFTVT